jgi:hypothetical protein
MDRSVDWASVRAGLKDDLGVALRARTGSDPDQPFAAIAGALLPALAEPMIERWVTPETIGALVREAAAEPDRPDRAPIEVGAGADAGAAEPRALSAVEPDEPSDFEQFRRAVRSARFTGPSAFELVLVDPEAAPAEQVPLRVELGLRGARWIVERVHLPESFLRRAGG